MTKKRRESKAPKAGLLKCPTGIRGLDEITGGGLPRGRGTLVCGAAGCGKTLLAMEFLVRGAIELDEPGALVSFEESEEELADNDASMGFDLPALVRREKIALDHIRIERSEIAETGAYDLEGLFVRLNDAIDSIGAKRVVLDTLEALFAGLPNEAVLRAELRRHFRWLKDKGVTAVITAERGGEHPPGTLWELRLYVSGQTPRSRAALANLEKICEEHLVGIYRIEVIDLLKEPQLAKGDQILAIPTLVRRLPKPMRKIIGDLSDTERVLVGLDLRCADEVG